MMILTIYDVIKAHQQLLDLFKNGDMVVLQQTLKEPAVRSRNAELVPLYDRMTML